MKNGTVQSEGWISQGLKFALNQDMMWIPNKTPNNPIVLSLSDVLRII